MTASLPHVVFQQIQRADRRKVLANFAAATPAQLQDYLAYRAPSGSSKSMLEASVASADPEIVRAVLLAGPSFKTGENSRRAWNNWSLHMSENGPRAHPTRGKKIPFDQLDALFQVLVDHGVGRSDLKGVCWGPVHMAIRANDPQRTVSRLERLEQAGYGLDDVDEIGETPLSTATWDLCAHGMAFLIDRGASLSSRTKGGRSILSFVFRDQANQDDKATRMEEVHAALTVLADAGYDFHSEIADRDNLKKNWPADTFDQAWSVIDSVLQQRALEANTPLPRPASPRSGRRL